MQRWALFCEHADDAEALQALVDSLIELHVDWVNADLFEHVREWLGDPELRARTKFFDVHHWDKLARRWGVLAPQGHFNGAPAQPGAAMLSTIVRTMRAMPADQRPTALIVVWDGDKQADARRAGFAQARALGELPASMVMVAAIAVPEHEAWVIAAIDEQERRDALDAARERLGFAPHREPERLSAGAGAAKNDAKNTLDALAEGCAHPTHEWLVVSDHRKREVLLERGERCGLATFIRDVEATLIAKIDPSLKTPRP